VERFSSPKFSGRKGEREREREKEKREGEASDKGEDSDRVAAS
jgi:hypothetical protein